MTFSNSLSLLLTIKGTVSSVPLFVNHETGKCEGRKSYAEIDIDMVNEAKRLRRKNPKTGRRRSLRRISKELFLQGYMTSKSTAFSAGQIKRLIT